MQFLNMIVITELIFEDYKEFTLYYKENTMCAKWFNVHHKFPHLLIRADSEYLSHPAIIIKFT